MSSILDKPSVRRAALPISLAQYHRLSAQAIISERTELLQGVIIGQMTKSPRHTYIVGLLVKWLESVVEAGLHVRKEEPLTLTDSEPEPDLAVVRGTAEEYRERHPSTAELVIEVALATLELDRDKAEVYAAAGIAEYWIVVPEERSVERYRDPSPSGYQDRTRLSGDNALLSPRGMPQASIPLSRLFA